MTTEQVAGGTWTSSMSVGHRYPHQPGYFFTQARAAAISQAPAGCQRLVRMVTRCRSNVQTGASSLRAIRASRVMGWSEYFRKPTVASR